MSKMRMIKRTCVKPTFQKKILNSHNVRMDSTKEDKKTKKISFIMKCHESRICKTLKKFPNIANYNGHVGRPTDGFESAQGGRKLTKEMLRQETV